MKKAENASVRIIPLGGLEQIGMSMMTVLLLWIVAYLSQRKICLVLI